MTTNEEKHFGKLIFPEENKTIENIWLTITDSKIFVEMPDPELKKTEWGVVWGVFNKLGNVTLVECGLSSQIHGIGGNVRKLAVHKLIQGIHLENKYQAFIESIQFESETLNEWASNYVSHDIDISDISFDSLPEPVNIFQHQFQNFNIEMKLAHKSSYSFLSYHIRRTFIIDVSFSKKINIYELYSFKRKLEQLVLFVTNEDPGILVVGYNKLGKKILGIHKTLNANRFFHSINLSFTIVKDKFVSVLKIWFEEKEIESIYELLLERKNNPDLSIARHFLNLSVGIESFHSKFINKKERVDGDEVVVNRNKIIELIKSEDDLLKWFKGQSSYWKKIDLIDRLRDLKPWFDYITENVFPFSTEDLLEKIKGTRNKLAHEGKYLTHFSELELYISGYTLEMVLRLLIIQKLGLDESLEELKLEAKNIINLVAKGNNYNQKTELNTKE